MEYLYVLTYCALHTQTSPDLTESGRRTRVGVGHLYKGFRIIDAETNRTYVHISKGRGRETRGSEHAGTISCSCRSYRRTDEITTYIRYLCNYLLHPFFFYSFFLFCTIAGEYLLLYLECSIHGNAILPDSRFFFFLFSVFLVLCSAFNLIAIDHRNGELRYSKSM